MHIGHWQIILIDLYRYNDIPTTYKIPLHGSIEIQHVLFPISQLSKEAVDAV